MNAFSRGASRHGQTLIELLMVISLMLLGLGAMIVNTSRGSERHDCKGLALAVAGELRDTRNQARSRGAARAVCIPTADATTPCAQSMYVLAGNGYTKPRRIIDFKRQYSGCYLFVGTWSRAPKTYTIDDPSPPTLTYPVSDPFEITPYPPSLPATPPPPKFGPPLLVASWTSPQINDFIFAFDSEGHLTTNDLPHVVGGSYNIVVCDGLDFSPTAVPTGTPTTGTFAPPYFKLNSVNQAYTISVSPGGGVSVRTGLVEADASVVRTTKKPSVPPLSPAKPPVLSTVNVKPIIADMSVLPVGNPVNGPAFDTTIPPNGRVSVTMQAYDPDGDDLVSSWTCTGGTYTVPPVGLDLNYGKGGVGQIKVDWVPPVSATNGSVYYLSGTATDPGGLSDTTTGSATVAVQVLVSGRVAFEASEGSDSDIYIMNGDGTSPKNLMSNNGSEDTWPVISPNGTKIAFVSNRAQSYKVGATTVTANIKRIFVMDADGSNVRAMTNVKGCDPLNPDVTATAASSDDCPSWSPDGSRIVFARTTGGVSKIQIINMAGRNIGPNLDDGTAPSWCRIPGGKEIAYQKTKTSGTPPVSTTSIYTMSTAGASSSVKVSPNSNDRLPVWSPDGTRILYLDGADIMEVKKTGGTPVKKGTGGRVAFSPSGREFITPNAEFFRFLDPGLASAATGTPMPLQFPFTATNFRICSWEKSP